MKGAYYNEIDPYAAQWLRNLIAAGHITPGDVDERSIVDVKADDLAGYTQCHFFAGIGVWSHSLRLAGWPDDREVWTGSCPCQPFSAAGKQKGTADARHLWPDWFRLIREWRPGVVFGEQVSAAIRHGWLDLVSGDLESADYTFGAAVVGAHSVGAPHIRQRCYFVANNNNNPSTNGELELEIFQRNVRQEERRAEAPNGFTNSSDCGIGVVADATRKQWDGGPEGWENSERHGAAPSGDDWLVAHDETGRRGGVNPDAGRRDERDGAQGGERLVGGNRTGGSVEHTESEQVGVPGCPRIARSAGFWSACDWLPCIDGKARPVEPGTFPLVNGATGRVGRLRAYGNAIVAPCAEEFIRAFMDVKGNS